MRVRSYQHLPENPLSRVSEVPSCRDPPALLVGSPNQNLTWGHTLTQKLHSYIQKNMHMESQIQAYCVYWCPDIPQCPSTIELYVPTEEYHTRVGTNAHSYTPQCARSSQTQGGWEEARSNNLM